MKIDIETKDNGAILHLEGKIIGDSVSKLKQVINELLDSGIDWMILDLADVPLMDSSALGTVIMAYLKLKQKNGKLGLLYAQKSILNILNITKLNTLLEVHDDIQSALRSMPIRQLADSYE